MSFPALEDLQQTWARQAGLRNDVVRWRWFEPAMQSAFAQAATLQHVALDVNGEALSRVFFDWVHEVESQQHLEAVDPLDFRHAIAGLLLQHLFAAQFPAPGHAALLSLQGEGDSRGHAGALITSVAWTLLQALRLQSASPAIAPDADLPQYWDSYLENAAQQAATAIGFFDRMAGLEPVWRTPTVLDQRPAMRAARAANRQPAPY